MWKTVAASHGSIARIRSPRPRVEVWSSGAPARAALAHWPLATLDPVSLSTRVRGGESFGQRPSDQLQTLVLGEDADAMSDPSALSVPITSKHGCSALNSSW